MRVVHCREEPYTTYIGRPSIYGNPFPVKANSTRDEVIAKYEKYARNCPDLLEQIKALSEDAVLGCFCYPKPCHGDVIVKLWKEMHA